MQLSGGLSIYGYKWGQRFGQTHMKVTRTRLDLCSQWEVVFD